MIASDDTSVGPGPGFLKRYLPALFLAATIVTAAPVMGQLRDLFFHAFPGRSLKIIAAFLAAVAGALFLAALWRIREHRALRYGGLVIVALLLWLQVVGFQRGIAQVDVVERFHVLEYGTLAALVFWGLSRRRPPAGWLELAALPVCAATCAGLLDEGAQRFFQLRVADFHDVLLNAFAAVVGTLFAALMAPPARVAPWLKGTPRVLRALALTLAGLGLFAVVAHFGYEIHDPELGRFRSFYEREALREAAAERAARWATAPPDGLDPWARKDLFLDEAARHTTFRNDALTGGRWAEALRANQILERYYAPFLDIPFRGSGGSRWSPELVADMQGKLRAAGDRELAAGWYCPVLREHLVLIPKAPFLAALAAAVALLLAAAVPVGKP